MHQQLSNDLVANRRRPAGKGLGHLEACRDLQYGEGIMEWSPQSRHPQDQPTPEQEDPGRW